VIAVFDGHNDALTSKDHARLANVREGGHLDLPRMRAGGMRGGLFALFTPSPDDESGERAFGNGGTFAEPLAEPVPYEIAAADATSVAGRLFALERAGEVTVARSIADVDGALAAGAPPVAVLHMEGSIGPVWSRANAFATGVQFVFPCSPDIGPGLTDAGVALVKACAEIGILIDLSHLNEKGFWDVAKLEPGSLVASHSGAHAVAPASRNLTDAQLDAIGETGGLVGIVYATAFIRADMADDPETPLSAIADHARYVADRIGVRHVGLGSDFDGATIPAPLGDVAGLPKLLDALRAVGFSEDELDQIGWSNWRRVLNAWWC
jgi:membrane dipeptidase